MILLVLLYFDFLMFWSILLWEFLHSKRERKDPLPSSRRHNSCKTFVIAKWKQHLFAIIIIWCEKLGFKSHNFVFNMAQSLDELNITSAIHFNYYLNFCLLIELWPKLPLLETKNSLCWNSITTWVQLFFQLYYDYIVIFFQLYYDHEHYKSTFNCWSFPWCTSISKSIWLK